MENAVEGVFQYIKALFAPSGKIEGNGKKSKVHSNFACSPMAGTRHFKCSHSGNVSASRKR